jgi:hypothetical protein
MDEIVGDVWRVPRLVFRDVASSTNQRTLVTAVIPPAAHGNKSPSLDGLPDPFEMAGLLGSLTVDFLVRMKVSATINWFYAETIPVPRTEGSLFGRIGADLTRRLNAVSVDFGRPASAPLVAAPERLAARLVLDAAVADLFALAPSDMELIAGRFPIYDRDAPKGFRYPELAVEVFRALKDEDFDAATRRADELARTRAKSDDCGLDWMFEPPGGWPRANAEAEGELALPTR